MEEAPGYLPDLARTLRKVKGLADAALAQITDEQLHRQIDAEANSIAVLMQHLAGNLRSRFTDFLTTDGEKPDRDRDAEFVAEQPSRATLVRRWNEGWDTVLAAVAALQPSDLARTVYIRREPFLVLEALNRTASHAAYHVGQIVLLAKHFAGPGWQTLTIPKGRSAEYTVGGYKQEKPPA